MFTLGSMCIYNNYLYNKYYNIIFATFYFPQIKFMDLTCSEVSPSCIPYHKTILSYYHQHLPHLAFFRDDTAYTFIQFSIKLKKINIAWIRYIYTISDALYQHLTDASIYIPICHFMISIHLFINLSTLSNHKYTHVIIFIFKLLLYVFLHKYFLYVFLYIQLLKL